MKDSTAMALSILVILLGTGLAGGIVGHAISDSEPVEAGLGHKWQCEGKEQAFKLDDTVVAGVPCEAVESK